VKLLSFVVPFVLSAAVAAQTTVVVPCTLDNTLYQDLSGSTSNGVGRSVFVGENGVGLARRALLRFDVAAAVPAGAKIVAASLQMHVVLTQDALPLPIDVHRVSASWGEGNSSASGPGGGGGAGTTAQTNDATWLHRLYPASMWTTPGGDFAPTPSFSFAMPTGGTFTVPANPGLVADVQSFRDNPGTNFGWVLKANQENISYTARRLDSRQSTTVANRPTLSITYLLPGQTATFGTGCPSPVSPFTAGWSGPMVGGTTLNLNHTNGPANGIGANLFALELNQPGVLVAPSCSIFLPLSGNWIAGNVFVFDGAGAAASPWPVPTAYPGLFFMSQSLAPDVTAPFGLVFSNAVVAVIQ